MRTPVIFLHGASSSGKSTLAREIQAQAALPFWHLSIDTFRESGAWPMARYRAGDFDWQADRARLFAGFHAMLGAAISAENPLILEHILDDPTWLSTVRSALAGSDVLFVALHCDPATLTAREAARGDRPLGSALQDYQNIHKGLLYDIELNSEVDIRQNAQTVLRALALPQRRSSFSAT